MNNLRLHILKTGGTIEFHDSDYEYINKQLLQLDTSIEAYLYKLVQPHFEYSTNLVFSKDSRQINESDRHKLVDAIIASPYTNTQIY
jgi:L-asparaginase/Glu-tRNA(Gln) amidotransferase subunit D